jgi:DNA polymerase elongation subunit (family B)
VAVPDSQDYYIEHQILSVVYKIMREFGYSKTDLEKGGQQKSLFNF